MLPWFLALCETARPGAIWDVGANIGIYALLARAYTEREVVGFEPTPEVCAWGRRLAADNGLTDLATAVLFAATLAAAWWAIRRTPGAARWCRLLPLAALLGFLDEVHFGAGLFGFDFPQVGPVRVDGFSGLLAAGQHLAENQLGLSPLDLAAGAALVAAVGAFVLARRQRAARAVAWLTDHPPAVHLLASASLATLAVALDLFAGSGLLRFVEEWLEFVAAALLFRGTLLILRHEPPALGWRQRLRPWLDGDTAPRAVPSAAPWRTGS